MKKILFSLGAMVVLLQFSCVAEASQGKYIIQDFPVTFTQTQETQTVDKKTTTETKAEPEEQNVKQEVSAPDTTNEQNAVQQETKPEQDVQNEQNVKKQQEEVQKQDAKAEQKAQAEKTEKIAEILDKSLDNANLIVNNSTIISVNGLLQMQKAIYQNAPEVAEFENRVAERNEIQDEVEKAQAFSDIKLELINSINDKLNTTDFQNLSQEEKYTWGKGAFYLKVAQNRIDNVANNLSPFYKGLLNGDLEQKSFAKQLKKAENLTNKMVAETKAQENLIAVADKVNVANQINIKIPEKEQVVINPNGAIFAVDKQLSSLNRYLLESYKETVSNFEFEEYVDNAKGENFDSLSDEEKIDTLQSALKSGITDGFDNLIVEKGKNPDLALTQEQVTSAVKIVNTISVLSNEYTKNIQEAKDLIKKINKNKMLKKCMVFDLNKLNKDIEMANKNFEDMKVLQPTTQQFLEAFNIENPIK